MATIKPFLLIVCVAVLSGCAARAQSALDTATIDAPSNPAVYDRLPSDYALPPYIRIVSLPLVENMKITPKENTTLLGEYWLFSNDGFTLIVGSLPSVDAATAYIRHHDLNPDAIQFIALDDKPDTLVSALYGHFKTRDSARQAQHSLSLAGAQIVSLRDLKAKRCESLNTTAVKALCAGAPVKTLSLAEVVE